MRCSASSISQFVVVLAVGLSLIAGCGDSKGSRGPTGKVSGKVTFDGKPLPSGCTIVFTHQDKAVAITAPIGSDGSYSLPNALVGTHKVSFMVPVEAAAAAPPDPSNPEAYKAFMLGQAKAPTEDKPPIPKRYCSPDQSGLTFTVQEGENKYDIDLKQ